MVVSMELIRLRRWKRRTRVLLSCQCVQHTKSKDSRSMSPAVGREGHRLTHSITAPNGAPPSGGRDSFLNYFFGKENGGNAYPGQLPGQSSAGAMAPGSRHVSQNLEPSISASFRRGGHEDDECA